MRLRFLCVAKVAAVSAALIGCTLQVRADRTVVIYNEDSDNIMRAFWHKDPAHYTEQEVRDYYGKVLGPGHVTHLFACVNARLSAYPSKVDAPYWAALDEPTMDHPQWLQAMRDLVVNQGVDQFKVCFGMCREKGVSPWVSFRMNDIHFVNDPKFFLNTGFWREHPELWINPASSNRTDCGWYQKAFDYRKKPVQDHMLAYIDEALGRYDVDGIELDWMRFEHHVPRAVARTEGAEAINGFMRRAHELVARHAKRRGHPIRIAARVDTEPASALNHGTDYRTWAKEGLIDWLIPCNFFQTVDFDLPFARWAAEVKALNPRVTVIPGLDCGVMPDGTYASKRFLKPDEYAAWGDRMFGQGATGAYFFNLFCNPSDEEKSSWDSWNFIINEGFTPENVAKHAKSVPPKAPRECVLSGWYVPDVGGK